MSDDLVKRLRDVAGVIIGAQSQNLEEDYGLAREAADRIEKLEAALTPSAATKADYIGEFKFKISPRREVLVPWTTIKEIMAAIMARAALEGKDD